MYLSPTSPEITTSRPTGFPMRPTLSWEEHAAWVVENHDSHRRKPRFLLPATPIPQVRRTCRGRAALGARLGTRARKPGMGGVGFGGSLSPSSVQGPHTGGHHVLPAREPGEGRDERGGVSPGSSAPSGPSPRSSAGRPSPSLCGPALTSGREGAGCRGCWGAARRLPAGLSGGQRQRGRLRGRCSWLVAPGALRPRPRRRLPPRPLRGLRAGTQLTPLPRSPPPLRLLGADRAASSAAPRAAGPAAASAAQRPAPGSPPPPPASQPTPRSQPPCDAGRRARELPPLQRPPRAGHSPGRAAARRWGLSSGCGKKSSRGFPAGPLRPPTRPPGGSAGEPAGSSDAPIPNNARKTRLRRARRLRRCCTSSPDFNQSWI
ncbi:uncharacterized protein WM277_024597 [Molossus nigricans]